MLVIEMLLLLLVLLIIICKHVEYISYIMNKSILIHTSFMKINIITIMTMMKVIRLIIMMRINKMMIIKVIIITEKCSQTSLKSQR